MQSPKDKVPFEFTEEPIKLSVVKPGRTVRLAFWGLRIYIVLMVGLVAWGFMRGMH
jgi:hypothetical protein